MMTVLGVLLSLSLCLSGLGDMRECHGEFTRDVSSADVDDCLDWMLDGVHRGHPRGTLGLSSVLCLNLQHE